MNIPPPKFSANPLISIGLFEPSTIQLALEKINALSFNIIF